MTLLIICIVGLILWILLVLVVARFCALSSVDEDLDRRQVGIDADPPVRKAG
jgi:hypothetical protein